MLWWPHLPETRNVGCTGQLAHRKRCDDVSGKLKVARALTHTRANAVRDTHEARSGLQVTLTKCGSRFQSGTVIVNRIIFFGRRWNQKFIQLEQSVREIVSE